MTQHSPRWLEDVRQLTKALVAIPSVSPDGEAENRCAEAICELLTQPYSVTSAIPDLHPHLWQTGDGRNIVACLLKSKHPDNKGKTIILMSHFDTVGVEDFARLGDSMLAFKPDKLAKVIHGNLSPKYENGSLDELEASAFQALQSGEWMFGRGSVDMKSGVAIDIAVLGAFAQVQADGKRLIDELEGNLLFVACPDEETESAGILSAVSELLKLRDEENLNYLGVINTDYTAPRGEDEDERYIYSGTIGKLLPSFYILGVRTHVGEIFRGVDAAHIAAELVRQINLNQEWIDTWKGSLGNEEITEVAPPPVALYMRDLKSSYNVETAGEAFVYINWLTLTLTPKQTMPKMIAAAHTALEAVHTRREESFRYFESSGGQAQTPPEWTPSVLDYESLLNLANKQWAKEKHEGAFSDWLKAKVDAFKADIQDSRQLSCMIVAELSKVAQITGPAIIAFFSPPYYPAIQPQENAITRVLSSVLANFSESIQMRGYYPYISDLSYVRLDADVDIESLQKHMPLFDLKRTSGKLHYPLSTELLSSIRDLNCPVVNIGPFGRDAHGLYERVHMPYSFQTVPQIIFETISQVLNPQ